jgi:hypothetical protein
VYGIKPCSWLRQTKQIWDKRYQTQVEAGLQSKSRCSHFSSSTKADKRIEAFALSIRKK